LVSLAVEWYGLGPHENELVRGERECGLNKEEMKARRRNWRISGFIFSSEFAWAMNVLN
jgi:hypothetical protein